MSDTEARKDELLALNSIFDKNVSTTEMDSGGELLIHCKLPEDFHIVLRNEEHMLACQAGARVEEKDGNSLIHVRFLPPLVLRFNYPGDYPSCSAPNYSISCKWLSQKQIDVVCQSLDNIWEDNRGEVILFLWANFLENEVLNDLGVTATLMLEYDKPVLSYCPLSSGNGSTMPKIKESGREQTCHASSSPECSTITEIVTFDLARKTKVFRASVFTCGICYSEAQGNDCVSFVPCEHVYCKECVTAHFSVNIADGRVFGLCCPETDCDSMAIPGQVKDLVTKSIFERYDTLLLQTSLDSMDDIFYCPRPGCRAAVIKDSAGHLAGCSLCRFVFCTLCGKPNHGVFDCEKAKRELIEKMKRMKIEEAERGKKEEDERRLMRQLEELAGEEYLMRNSKRCSACGFHIQKLSGCNKMMCSRCNNYFCWICLKSLDKNRPYQHFEDPDSGCFRLLGSYVEDNYDD